MMTEDRARQIALMLVYHSAKKRELRIDPTIGEHEIANTAKKVGISMDEAKKYYVQVILPTALNAWMKENICVILIV